MMKSLGNIFFLLVICVSLIQCSTSKKSTKKQRPARIEQNDPMSQAIRAARKGDYNGAISILNQMHEADPYNAEVLARRGTMYFELDNHKQALEDFDQAIAIHPDFNPEIYYSAGKVAMDFGSYDKAIGYYEQYINRQKNNPKKVENVKELLKTAKFRASIVETEFNIDARPISGDVNTENSEYSPSLSLDENKMVFTKRIGGQEDLYIATRDGDNWINAQEIEGVNTLGNEGGHTLSSDGRTIIFTACHRKLGIGGCDLFITKLENGKWSNPVVMDKFVNTPAWESQPCLSADGRTLIFCSSRVEGIGLHDIWMSKMGENGDWLPAKNLGPSINTTKNEESPYLHPDGKTLYFRSDGHPGLGSFDLFMSKWDEQNEEWGKPINLGSPINTSGNEGALTISNDGKTGYYASDIASIQDGSVRKNLDIYQFNVPKHLRPNPVTYVSAQVIDAETNERITAEATLTNQSNQSVYSERIDDSGSFILALPAGSNYTLTVDKTGYKYYLDLIDLQEIRDIYTPMQLTIRLQRIPDTIETVEEKPIVLDHIYFASGSAELLSSSQYEINQLHQLLIKDPNLKMKIIGHTDNVGSIDDNLRLSQSRAKAVVDAIIKNGLINEDRLIAIGKGETSPIADNSTEEGRAKNRRTEVVFMR